MQATMSEKTGQGVDKTKRYGWVTKDAPGELRNLHKDVLQIHPAYQRDVLPMKVKEITGSWSWAACGAIVVGERGGEFWVIDGQHRVLAAKRRSDITHLPCVVFKTEGVRQEAVAFLDLNTGRKPVSSIGKFKAMIAAGDETACFVHKTLESLGVTMNQNAKKAKELRSVSWAVRRAGEDGEKFATIMRIGVELSHDTPIQEKLLEGLWYINERLPGGIEQKRFMDRLRAVGAQGLIDAANKAAAYFVQGGAKVWATGMMDAVNKGLHKKYEIGGEGGI